ncbi:MAG: LemA family protein [Bacilli bacterium]|nr:LemA family protein [Bacilli bacterium]
MNLNLKPGLIVGGIILLLVVLFGASYNDLVTKQENVDSKLSNISVQLERRADLIPNLINTVKGYVNHENDVIDKITSARERLLKADNMEEKLAINDELTSSLNNLFVIVENYPDLKSNTNFLNLQDELAGTENRIATARHEYNEAVKEYNQAMKSFPKNIIAKLFGFKEKTYFENKESSYDVPEVNFD